MTDHEAIQDVHRRLDSQDKALASQNALLLEIRDTMTSHIATEAAIKPAVDELITLYKGSKLIIPMLASAAVALWAFLTWAKDHIK